MNGNILSKKIENLINKAASLGRKLGHDTITEMHLLNVIVKDQQVKNHIVQLGGNPDQIGKVTQDILAKMPKGQGQDVRLSTNLNKILSRTVELAQQKGNQDDLDHLFQALREVPSPASDLISGRPLRADGESDPRFRYCENLIEKAAQGKIDPIIGRDEEIRRIIQVLCRRTKNNPVLIGEPGVGKTAIIEGLALRIVNGDVPENLLKKGLWALDLGALIAGTGVRGEFEERMKSVIKAFTESVGEDILFVDEMHSLIGAGQAEGSVDASNLLKPALARGDLRCVGATTLDEYRKHVEKDAALTRRFQPVYVKEPTVEDTISILRGIKEKYELHHGIGISDNALVSAAKMSSRYITDRKLPDKAIDLIDEAASRFRMEIDSKPDELDALDRRIVQVKIEIEALEGENDATSASKVDSLKEELVGLESKSKELTEEWKEEKFRLSKIRLVKEKLDQARIDLEQAVRDGNLNEAGRLQYGVIPECEKELVEYEGSERREDKVTAEMVANVVEKWTGIPVSRLIEGEKEKLLRMEVEIGKRVISQNEAITAVSNAVRRSRTGLTDPNRPVGSFLFLGPTGVGKTELCKALAEFIFDDPSAMIRIDMSEYMEKHSVARLIGSPPGYVGYEDGGQITEAVRRRPYQVILFDEIEKAHKEVFNLFLQLLDEGTLTDGHGKKVSFKETIIIFTSNLGTAEISQLGEKYSHEKATEIAMNEVQNFFRPEFINRLDEIILFRKLSHDDMVKIVDIQMADLANRLMQSDIEIVIDDDCREWLAEEGFDPIFGARPLKRVVQRNIVDKLAEQMLLGKISEGKKVTVSHDRLHGITFNNQRMFTTRRIEPLSKTLH